jgi:hypothetical protein
VAHEAPLALPRGHSDDLSFAASPTHLVVLHRDRYFDDDGKYAHELTAAFELRAAPFGERTQPIVRCQAEGNSFAYWERLSFAVDDATLAYGPAPCPRSDPISVVVRDLETGGPGAGLPQPPGTTTVTDLRVAGAYVAWVRHFGRLDENTTVAEIVVADTASGTEVLRLREGREIPSVPMGLALQEDGKVAFVVRTPGRPGGAPARLAWASPGSTGVHFLPVNPATFLVAYDVAIAADRIAFILNLDDACTNLRDHHYAVALSDLSGRVRLVGPAGYGGRFTAAGYDGRRITWLRNRPRQALIVLQDVAALRLRRYRDAPPCTT